MEAVDLERRALRDAALRGTGLPTRVTRVWAGQVLSHGEEALLMTLPFNDADTEPLQDGSGAPYFMWDVSPFDGADPHA